MNDMLTHTAHTPEQLREIAERANAAVRTRNERTQSTYARIAEFRDGRPVHMAQLVEVAGYGEDEYDGLVGAVLVASSGLVTTEVLQEDVFVHRNPVTASTAAASWARGKSR